MMVLHEGGIMMSNMVNHPSADESVIRFMNISKSFGKGRDRLSVLRQVSFEVVPHEIMGIVGESGAGKSTLLSLINGMEVPDEGEILIHGRSSSGLSNQRLRELRQNSAMIFQEYNLLRNKSVFDNVALSLRLRKTRADSKVMDALRFVGLDHKGKAQIKTLSGGEKQRVAIARALVTQPAILLADEPTSSLDPGMTREIIDLLKQINSVFHTTIILVSHDLEVIKALCQRAIILRDGEVFDTIAVQEPAAQWQYPDYAEQARMVLSR